MCIAIYIKVDKVIKCGQSDTLWTSKQDFLDEFELVYMRQDGKCTKCFSKQRALQIEQKCKRNGETSN